MSEEEKKLSDAQQQQIDAINKDAAFRKKAEKEMTANESIQNYLKQFNPASVTQFINQYLTYKTMWHHHGEFYLRQHEKHDLQWIEDASKRLQEIQQKKLFDLQCLWRAGKIELPGIEISFDFQIWEDNVLNCSFIEPITKDDVELYQQYLLQNNVDLDDSMMFSFINWQSYAELKEAYESGNASHNFPEWYDFYNGRKGTGVYMTLPDLKGEKENFYRKLVVDLDPERKKASAQIRESLANPLKPRSDKEGRPIISFHREEFTNWFVETFEDKLTRQYYRAYSWNNRNRDDEEELEAAMAFLYSAEEYVPIEGHYDWKEAVKKAAQTFRRKKISEALPEAFDQYLLNKSMNIAFPSKESPLLQACETIKKEIIKGRILNGEPGDLNY